MPFVPVKDPAFTHALVKPTTFAGVRVDTIAMREPVGADKQSHQVLIAGKSLTDALAKSSIQVKPGNYSGSTIEQATRAVLAPFSVGLKMVNAPPIATNTFSSLVVQYGEAAAAFIQRMLVTRGMFVTDDADGNLVIGSGDPSAASVATLVEGGNILSLSGSIDNDSAWGKYAGVSQQIGNDDNYPPRSFSASVTNANFPQAHLNLFIAEHLADSQELVARVNYEQAVSLWRVINVTVTVPGWYRPDGQLWQPANNVSVYSPSFFPNQSGMFTLGIQSVVWSQDSQTGSTTALTLVLPNALSSRPLAGIPDASASSAGFVGQVATNPIPTSAMVDSPDHMVST